MILGFTETRKGMSLWQVKELSSFLKHFLEVVRSGTWATVRQARSLGRPVFIL
jgi:hypothetical protein